MYDHATKSYWSTLKGQPVVGPLVGKGIELKRHHVVTTTWGEWKRRHPETTVLSLETGHHRDYGEGVAYRKYFSTDQLMFAVPKMDNRLKNKQEILALRDGEEQLAVSTEYLKRHPVFQDSIGDEQFVVLTDPSGANRVYESGTSQFVAWDGDKTATDRDGRKWNVASEELTSGKRRLKRLPSHRAFWFGWYSQFPQSRLVK